MSYQDTASVLREYFNIGDKTTRRTLIEADDTDRNQLLTALTSKLYDQIVSKVDQIDFGTIPRSRGDITKIENYAQLMECISILRGILEQSKENTTPIDVVQTAVENLRTRSRMFMKAFATGVEMPILVYNTVTLAAVSSISFLIASCIEYIKNPGSETFEISIDRTAYYKTKDNLLFENLRAFNEGCRKGEVDEALNGVLKNFRIRAEATADVMEDPMDPITDDQSTVVHDENDPLREDMDIGLLAIPIAIIRCIIPFLRSLVYFFFHARQSMSDYMAIQAELIEMNAYKVQYNTDIAVDKRKDIYNRQMKIASSLRNISNKFSLTYNKSRKEVENMQRNVRKDYKVEEFPEVTPAISGQSVLF